MVSVCCKLSGTSEGILYFPISRGEPSLPEQGARPAATARFHCWLSVDREIQEWRCGLEAKLDRHNEREGRGR